MSDTDAPLIPNAVELDELDDGFEEILRETPEMRRDPCTIRCSLLGRRDGARSARRVSLTFRPSRLDQDVVQVLNGPRFKVAFNPEMGVIRLRACDDGPHQLTLAPGRAKENGERERTYLLRFPFPARGMEWCEERVMVDPDVNVAQRALLIELPSQFRPQVKRLPPPAVRRPEIPVDKTVRGRTVEDDLAVLRMIGVRRNFPRTIRGQKFTPSEACILEALYRRERVSREGLLMATHEPGAEEDDRDDKVVDVWISKMRQRLHAIGLAIMNDREGMFCMSSMHRQKMKEYLIEEGVE